MKKSSFSTLSFSARAAFCHSEQAKKLFQLMDAKQTNLALSADVTSAKDLIDLAEQMGPHICLLKTHIDMINDFTPKLIQVLKKLAREYQFLLFEDRKFADIGNTVKNQYAHGIYHIAEWADIINAHSLPGPGVVTGLAEVGLLLNRGLLLIAEMSSAGHLMDHRYVEHTLAIAKQFPNFVIGFITQKALSSEPQWLYLTPGIQLVEGYDHLGQQYITPFDAIFNRGSDIIIVGRGILRAKDKVVTAHLYRKEAWRAYVERLNS